MNNDVISESHIVKILGSLGEITGELKGMSSRLDLINNRISKHEDKIDKNAIHLSGLTGKTIGIGAGAGAVITALVKGAEILIK